MRLRKTAATAGQAAATAGQAAAEPVFRFSDGLLWSEKENSFPGICFPPWKNGDG